MTLSLRRRFSNALLPAALLVFGLALGLVLGQHLALRDFQSAIGENEQVVTLGSAIDAEYAAEHADLDAVRRRYAQAYLDPERALRELDGYVWDVPAVPHPFVGSAPAPGRHANAEISTRHFRGSAKIDARAEDGVVRIFVTGGSTAFGSGAPSDDATIPALLGKRLTELDARDAPGGGRRFQVVGAASPGWTSTHERIWITNQLVGLDPAWVVALSGTTDIRWAALGYDVVRSRTPAERSWHTLLDRLYTQAAGSRLGGDLGRWNRRPRAGAVGRRLARNARLAALALAPEHARYLFALQPNLTLVGRPLSQREQALRARGERRLVGEAEYFQLCAAAIRRELEALARERMAYVDLTSVFDSGGGDAEVFLDSDHFGDRGNRVIADALAHALLEQLGDGKPAGR